MEKETTKKCPQCQSEIPEKAKRCPECQSDLRNWFRRHIILTIIGVLFLLGIVGGIMGEDSPPSESPSPSENSKTSIEEEEKEEIKEEDIVKASAEEVLNTFDDNEVKGNKLYKDKRIELTGIVEEISHSDFIEESYSLSIGTGKDFEFTTIRINADMSFENELMELNKGDYVTVLFDCEGLVANFYVEGDLVEIK